MIGCNRPEKTNEKINLGESYTVNIRLMIQFLVFQNCVTEGKFDTKGVSKLWQLTSV